MHDKAALSKTNSLLSYIYLICSLWIHFRKIFLDYILLCGQYNTIRSPPDYQSSKDKRNK